MVPVMMVGTHNLEAQPRLGGGVGGMYQMEELVGLVGVPVLPRVRALEVLEMHLKVIKGEMQPLMTTG
jgi:hypothetical protein